MKRNVSILVAALLLPVTLLAQQHLFLQEQDIVIDGNNATAWVFPVEGEIDNALDHLKDYCKERSKIKMKNKGTNLLIAEEVSIPAVSTKVGDLIGRGSPFESYNTVGIAFKLGYDIYLNSEQWNQEMTNLRNYAKEFMSYHYERSYKERIEAAEKEIKSLGKELSKGEKEVGKLGKKIDKINGKIADETDALEIQEMEAELTTLTVDQQRLQESLPQLRSRLELLKGDVNNLKNQSLTIQSAIISL